MLPLPIWKVYAGAPASGSGIFIDRFFLHLQLRLKIIQEFVYLLFSFLIVYGRNPKCIFKNDKI